MAKCKLLLLGRKVKDKATHVGDVRIRPERNVPVSIVGTGVQLPALVKLDICDVVTGVELNLQGPRAAERPVRGAGSEGKQVSNFDNTELEGHVDVVLKATVCAVVEGREDEDGVSFLGDVDGD